MLGYDIYAYGRMVRDRIRTDAYVEALRESVGPNSVVLDIGTGVGIWALLACKFGARRVYAVDPNDAIQVARELAAVNGYADRIEFIQDLSTRITLPEKADVLVTDMHGIVPMFEQHLPSMIDARRRLLAPGGKMIPKGETLWAAPVAAAECYEQVMHPWDDNAYDLDWGPARHIAANDWFGVKQELTTADFFAEGKAWATIEYETLASPNVSGDLRWTATRSGTCHGLVVWFDTQLTADISFSNAPGRPKTIFGQAFFPWSEPVSLSTNDTISTALRCDLVDNFHLWRWQTTVRSQRNTQEVKADFKQSNFFGMPLEQRTARRAREFAQ
jgi:protein arginine N-methyltransferase 1